MVREGLHIIIGSSVNVLCLCSITGTYVWREMFKIYLKRLFICKPTQKRVHQYGDNEVDDPTNRQCRSKSQVKNTDGKPLAFNLREEADIYFKQLDALWKV